MHMSEGTLSRVAEQMVVYFNCQIDYVRHLRKQYKLIERRHPGKASTGEYSHPKPQKLERKRTNTLEHT